MNLTQCPVCRRVKGFDDFLCAACIEKVGADKLRTRDALASLCSSQDRCDATAAEINLARFSSEIIAQLKRERAARKPFGFDVVVLCDSEPRRREFHWRGTEGAMQRKARLQSTFREIESMTPLTEAQWLRAYGLGRM